MQPVDKIQPSTAKSAAIFMTISRRSIPALLYVCLVLCVSILRYTPSGRITEYLYGAALLYYLAAGLHAIRKKRFLTAASFLIPPAFVAMLAAITPSGWIEGRAFELAVDLGLDPTSDQCRSKAIALQQVVYCKHIKFLLVASVDSESLVYDGRDQLHDQASCRNIETLMPPTEVVKLPWIGISVNTEISCKRIFDHYFSVTTANFQN